ncbi:MAG TPA: type 1 glutamine amidotransferase [Solirubrobacteraceae bacterium]|nr:type 1 glutamine amidotransferase [Solirubrobacteraceae bacterium]
MRVLSIVHERTAASGVFGEVLRDRGARVLEWVPPLGGPAPAPRPDAVLVFGGAMNCEQESDHGWLAPEKQHLRALLAAGTPALGVCLGAQLLAEVAGGSVTRMATPEIGWKSVRLQPDGEHDPVLASMPEWFEGFQWHSYEVSPREGWPVLARSDACVEAFRAAPAPWWGIQFHAEVTGDSVEGWIDDYRSDPDAVAAGIDWAALRAASAERIEGWNALGTRLCARFLDHAAALAGR